MQDTWFRIAIVPGKTPFLLSNAFLRTIKAVIDTEANTLWGKMLGKYLETSKSASNLMLLDLNQLWPQDVFAVQDTAPPSGVFEIHSTQTSCAEQNQSPAEVVLQSETEPCFGSRAIESNLTKPNPIKIEKSSIRSQKPIVESFEPNAKLDQSSQPSSSQAPLCQRTPVSRNHVQFEPEACRLPGRDQERTPTGRDRFARSDAAIT